jgi:hypothetical protein
MGRAVSSAVRRFKRLRDRWLIPAPQSAVPDLIRARPVGRKVVLISQIHRSGGTLLSQLLDGHPQIAAYPGDMHIARGEADWPDLDPALPARVLFRYLVDARFIERARTGYSKSKNPTKMHEFDYDVGLHRHIFGNLIQANRPVTQRDVLDCFYHAFFLSWRNRIVPYEGTTCISAFCPGLAMNSQSIARYFRDYPDGQLVSIVRDPVSWLASALSKNQGKARKRQYDQFDTAIVRWRQSAEATLRNKRDYGERVICISLDALVGDTAGMMRALCARVGIDFDESLTVPTFNSATIESNSSFDKSIGRVDSGVLTRRPDIEPAQMARLKEDCSVTFESLKACGLTPIPGTSAIAS